MNGYKRIRVFPERDLRATRLEMAVLDTSVFQRLRNIRQLGQSLVAFPTAEHSRFSHSLGALYWCSKMLSYLKENFFSSEHGTSAGNRRFLEDADATIARTILGGHPSPQKIGLEVPWFEQLARLAALLHDITHIPFGHTLEDQARLFARHDDDYARIRFVFGKLAGEIEDSPHFSPNHIGQQASALKQLLAACEALHLVEKWLKSPRPDKEQDEHPDLKKSEVLDAEKKLTEFLDSHKDFLPYLILVTDVVNNTICADLIDYLHRDSLNCGMPWTIDKALLGHLKILKTVGKHGPLRGAELLRLGVKVDRSGKLRHDVITAVLALLRARYDITEKVYFHHTKCAADAMLDRAMRTVDAGSITWRTIIEKGFGDEGFLRHLEAQLPETGQNLVGALQARRFCKAVYRIRGGSDWSKQTRTMVKQCTNPSGRSGVERRLENETKLKAGEIIVSCLPENMQLKEAAALVEWPDEDVVTLAQLPEVKGYLPEVSSLTARYRELWSLTVYVDARKPAFASAVAKACEKVFGRSNDPLMQHYLATRWETLRVLTDELDSIRLESEVEAASQLNVAAGGGDALAEIEPRLVARLAVRTALEGRDSPSEDSGQLQIESTPRSKPRKERA